MSAGRKAALEYVCQHAFTLQFVQYGGVVALLLTVAALLTLAPDSASYTVALINLPGIVFFTVGAAVVQRKCLQYE